MASTNPDPKHPPDFLDEFLSFKSLVGSLPLPLARQNTSQFVKKLDQIPEVLILSTTARQKALFFAS
jgi:hypothetical protein